MTRDIGGRQCQVHDFYFGMLQVLRKANIDIAVAAEELAQMETEHAAQQKVAAAARKPKAMVHNPEPFRPTLLTPSRPLTASCLNQCRTIPLAFLQAGNRCTKGVHLMVSYRARLLSAGGAFALSAGNLLRAQHILYLSRVNKYCLRDGPLAFGHAWSPPAFPRRTPYFRCPQRSAQGGARYPGPGSRLWPAGVRLRCVLA